MWDLIQWMTNFNADAMAAATPEQMEKLHEWNVLYVEVLEARDSLVSPNRWTKDTPVEDRQKWIDSNIALEALQTEAMNLITPGWDKPNYGLTPADRFGLDIDE